MRLWFLYGKDLFIKYVKNFVLCVAERGKKVFYKWLHGHVCMPDLKYFSRDSSLLFHFCYSQQNNSRSHHILGPDATCRNGVTASHSKLAIFVLTSDPETKMFQWGSAVLFIHCAGKIKKYGFTGDRFLNQLRYQNVYMAIRIDSESSELLNLVALLALPGVMGF